MTHPVLPFGLEAFNVNFIRLVLIHPSELTCLAFAHNLICSKKNHRGKRGSRILNKNSHKHIHAFPGSGQI